MKPPRLRWPRSSFFNTLRATIAADLARHSGWRPAKLARNLADRSSGRHPTRNLFALLRLKRSRGANPGSRLEPAFAPQHPKDAATTPIQTLADRLQRQTALPATPQRRPLLGREPSRHATPSLP